AGVTTTRKRCAATGTVTYEFFTTIDGTGSHADQVVTLVNGVVPDSAAHGPLMAGAYSFIAVYSGDSNYAGSTSAVEPLTVDKGPPATAPATQGPRPQPHTTASHVPAGPPQIVTATAPRA